MLFFPCHLFFSFSWVGIRLKEERGRQKSPFLAEPVLVQAEGGLWYSLPTQVVLLSPSRRAYTVT